MSISSESFIQPDPVLAALNEAGGEIRREGPSRWSFAAGPEETIKVTASFDQDWVVMDTPLVACEGTQWLQPKRLWNLLHANAALTGGAKFVVAGNPRSIRLRAEIHVTDEINLAGRIQNARVGFQEALRCFRCRKSGLLVDGPEPLHPANPEPSDTRLQALCAEAGWASSGRPDGGVAVRLEVPDGYYQATVRTDGRGLLSMWVELASEGSWSEDCWKALAVFLLQACGHLKTVRAAARHLDSGATTAGLQVVLDPSAGSEELGRAFSALSVACNLIGKEVRVLREQVVGKQYLAMVRGWSSRSGQANTKKAPSGAKQRGKR
jgi:hypothetical protein